MTVTIHELKNIEEIADNRMIIVPAGIMAIIS
jgi:hypothetical protein